MNKYFLAIYDEDDYPYAVCENFSEAAKLFRTTSASVRSSVCRFNKKVFEGKTYKFYKIVLNEDDIRIPKGSKNLHIGALLEVLNI